jgi:integrase/recombinase XerD
MKTHEGVLLGGWVRRFLLEHLVVERNLSLNTQRSYRDTIRLLIPLAAEQAAVDRLLVTEVSADVVRAFLRHVEERRGCGVRTRNQRLAAIHALATFVGERCPELIPWCGEVRAVPFKRYDRPSLCYLDKPEIDGLLAAPDRTTEQGRRDHAVLLFLYNTGARASEAAAVAIRDLDVRSDGSGSVRLVGKGSKTRHCPLWPTTMASLRAVSSGRSPDEPVCCVRTVRRRLHDGRSGACVSGHVGHA